MYKRQEKPRAVQAAHGLGGFFLGEFLTDLDGQITEHGARVGSLDPLYADIPHDKRVEGVSLSLIHILKT